MSQVRQSHAAAPGSSDMFVLTEQHGALLTRAIQRDIDATIAFGASLRRHGAPEVADGCDEEVAALLEMAEAFGLTVHLRED
ncbi:hypothetical protein [Roseomonas xinghualingensis]|uniref:hypothetical protein n=1 Tax=Roseomonas xinghualingensis TaxID=2986475 RepID=UPI0021F23880|nr:hypothetical protein [Roseomonas sp. SXEYE001]MCV4210004.1 hypothetical protein [Roseomonas sp. SXEYE001]